MPEIFFAIQVLLTEEITGSLRKLQAAPMMARERYRALQKRGVIEPRMRVAKRRGRRMTFAIGERAERAQLAQTEINDAKFKRKKLAKQSKRAD